MLYNIAMENGEQRSCLDLTKDTPYLILLAHPWDVFCVYWGKLAML